MRSLLYDLWGTRLSGLTVAAHRPRMRPFLPPRPSVLRLRLPVTTCVAPTRRAPSSSARRRSTPQKVQQERLRPEPAVLRATASIVQPPKSSA